MASTRDFMSKVGSARWDGPRAMSAIPNVATDQPYRDYLGCSMWAHSDGAYWGCPSAAAKIEPGFYRPQMSQRGPMARVAYLAAKAPDVAEAERERWAKASDGWSVAHLRELIVAHKALGDDVDETIARLSEMREARPNSDHGADRQRAGFSLREVA